MKKYYLNNRTTRLLKVKQYRDSPENFIKIKQWRKNNDKELKLKAKEWRKNNRAKTQKSWQRWYKKNQQKKISDNKNWVKNNKQRRRDSDNKYYIKNYISGTRYKIAMLLRTRLNMALKSNQRKGSAVYDLGCTIPELKLHIEKQWKEGMNWGNWKLRGWHIDHIKPLASFDLTNRKQLLQAVNFNNLQPMWWRENIVKGKRI